MDDDDVQESGIIGGDDSNTAKTAPTTTEPSAPLTEQAPAAPPKPPRPQTEAQKNTAILKEAFPGIDENVIKAILTASGGRIDPAFNALLEMTDPDAAKNEPQEEAPPPRPPRPAQAQAQMSQLEADEQYARQLAEHWDNVGAYEQRTANRGDRPGNQDREHSFFDDDLPVIQERLRQGFVETQGKVNSWITTMKKRFDEEFVDEEGSNRPNRPVPGQEQFPGPRAPGQSSRRSGDYERYDADPQVLSDDFAGMKFTADGTPVREGRDSDVFRPPPPSKSPRPSDGRRVAFREGAEEIDPYGASPKLGSDEALGSKSKTSKWQPLSTVDPNPINDNDPFSLGDSEDERDTKDKTGSKEIKLDDNERLKAAAAEAMADSLVDSKKEEESASAKKE